MIPDFDKLSPEDQLRTRIEYEFKFGSIMKRYPHFNIKIPSPEESLKSIHIRYMECLKKVTIDHGVFEYRQILVVIWAVLELFYVKVLGINASGFCMHQVMRMEKYDDMLRELGEKHNFEIGSGWSVEARLTFWTLVHSVIFIGMNYVAQWLGPEIAKQFRTLIDNFAAGRVEVPTIDEDGKVNIPAAPPPVPDAGNIMGIPIPQAAQFVGNIPLGNMNLFGGGRGNNGGNAGVNAGNNPNRIADILNGGTGNAGAGGAGGNNGGGNNGAGNNNAAPARRRRPKFDE